MAPEYIAQYLRKLFTLYSHSLAEPPAFADVHAAGDSLTRIKTQAEAREWIKQVVFSTQALE